MSAQYFWSGNGEKNEEVTAKFQIEIVISKIYILSYAMAFIERFDIDGSGCWPRASVQNDTNNSISYTNYLPSWEEV